MSNLLMWGIYILGVVVGCIISQTMIPYAGKLKIDQTNPEKDVYTFDMSMDLDKLPKKKRIKLTIDVKTQLSHDELPL